MAGLIKAFQSNIQPEAIEESNDPVDLAHRDLVIAVVALAVEEEGIQYLLDRDGDNWLASLGLDGEAIKTRLLHRMHRAELQEVA